MFFSCCFPILFSFVNFHHRIFLDSTVSSGLSVSSHPWLPTQSTSSSDVTSFKFRSSTVGKSENPCGSSSPRGVYGVPMCRVPCRRLGMKRCGNVSDVSCEKRMTSIDFRVRSEEVKGEVAKVSPDMSMTACPLTWHKT